MRLLQDLGADVGPIEALCHCFASIQALLVERGDSPLLVARLVDHKLVHYVARDLIFSGFFSLRYLLRAKLNRVRRRRQVGDLRRRTLSAGAVGIPLAVVKVTHHRAFESRLAQTSVRGGLEALVPSFVVLVPLSCHGLLDDVHAHDPPGFDVKVASNLLHGLELLVHLRFFLGQLIHEHLRLPESSSGLSFSRPLPFFRRYKVRDLALVSNRTVLLDELVLGANLRLRLDQRLVLQLHVR